MPPSSVDDSGSEVEIIPFPTLPLLERYVDNVRKSINNPSLQGAQIDFLMMNIVAILDALKGADENIAALTRQLDSLKIIHARLEVRCDQTHDNNGWLSERYKEAQKTNEALSAVNEKYESVVSLSSTKEQWLLRRVACLERAIHKLSALITKNRLQPYKAIQSWVDNSLPPSDHVYECDNFVEPPQQDQGVLVEVGGKRETAAILSIGPTITRKHWDDELNQTDSDYHSSVNSDDDASESPSEISVLTDAVKYKMFQNKLSREMRTTTQGIVTTRLGAKQNQPATSTTCASTVENTRPVRHAKPHIQPTELGNNIKPVEEHVVSAELIAHFPRSRSQPKIYPAANHLAQGPIDDSIQNSDEQQIGNTCEDRTRYADIARDHTGVNPAYADSINPQVVVADPNEVAGDWNDVPVPMELRRQKTPEKPLPSPLTYERSIFMVGLPPTITVSMLASFVRGGKIESIIIINEGKKVGIQSAVITFFSRKAAKRLMNWMLESPRLVIDRHVARPSPEMALPPPMIPSGGGSRVVIVKYIPVELQTDEQFWNFIHRVAAKYTFKIGVQETHIWKIDDTDEEKRFSGVVVFDTYQMGLQMNKILRQRLGLEVKWGHDRCEDPLLSEKFYEFVEYKKKKQYDSESD